MIAPKLVWLHSPHVPSRLLILSYLYSVAPACFWLVVACKKSCGSCLRLRGVLFLSFFCCSLWRPKQLDNIPSIPPLTHPCCQLLVGCCVPPLNGGRAMAAVYFFIIIFCSRFAPKWQQNIPPTRSAPVASLLKQSPSPDAIFYLIVAFIRWLVAT